MNFLLFLLNYFFATIEGLLNSRLLNLITWPKFARARWFIAQFTFDRKRRNWDISIINDFSSCKFLFNFIGVFQFFKLTTACDLQILDIQIPWICNCHKIMPLLISATTFLVIMRLLWGEEHTLYATRIPKGKQSQSLNLKSHKDLTNELSTLSNLVSYNNTISGWL